jgi:hypothetical protein
LTRVESNRSLARYSVFELLRWLVAGVRFRFIGLQHLDIGRVPKYRLCEATSRSRRVLHQTPRYYRRRFTYVKGQLTLAQRRIRRGDTVEAGQVLGPRLIDDLLKIWSWCCNIQQQVLPQRSLPQAAAPVLLNQGAKFRGPSSQPVGKTFFLNATEPAADMSRSTMVRAIKARSPC